MEPSSLMVTIQICIAIAVALGHGVVIYFVWQRIKTDNKYGRAWGNSWWFFLVAMIICFLRRAAIVTYSFGLGGPPYESMTWVDRYISNDVLTVLYLFFLFSLGRWWKGFYKQMNVLVGGVDITHVEVEEPEEVEIVGSDDKKVRIEKPKKILAIKPKRVDVVRKREEAVTKREDNVIVREEEAVTKREDNVTLREDAMDAKDK